MTAVPIHVASEFGPLREVIVGRGVMRYPDVEKAVWITELLKVLPEAEAEKARGRSRKSSRDLPKFELIEQENDALIDVLERLGVTVHRPDDITDELVAANFGREWLAQGYMQTFARDGVFVVGDNVIELAPGSPLRRADLLGLRRLFSERLSGSGAKWVQMPQVDYSRASREGYSKADEIVLEGGDLLVLGDTVLAGMTLNAAAGSSERGIQWLGDLLGPQGYTVQPVRLGEEFLHLDVVLSIPRDGLAIACREAFVDGLPPQLAGWDIIEVSARDARFMAVNGLPVDPGNYVMGVSEHSDGAEVQAGLELRGITVHRIGFANHMEDGGSVRCATHPLVRAEAR